MFCHGCGKPIQPDFKVCPYCGTSVKMFCSSCWRELQDDFRICPYCGTPIKTVETPPAPQATRPARPSVVEPSPASVSEAPRVVIETPPPLPPSRVAEPPPPTPPPHPSEAPPIEVATPPTPSVQPSFQGEQQPQYWLDLGNSYYDQHEYLKAGECYEKTYQISAASVFAVPQAVAYNAIKEREKRGLELYRVRPGVAVSLLSVPEVERKMGTGEMMIIFFNGSQEKAKIEVTPDIPKELEISESEFSVELWPGQYTLKSVRVRATDKAKLKEYTVSFNINSTGLRYRAGEAGVELASKVASKVIPFGGTLISWLGAKGLKSTMTLGIPLKVVETRYWTVFASNPDRTLEYWDISDKNWTMSLEAYNRLVGTLDANKQTYKLYTAIKKVVSYSGEENTKKDAVLWLYVKFKDDASAEFRGKKYEFLLYHRLGEGDFFRVVGSSEPPLEITKETFDRILDIAVNKPAEVKLLHAIGPEWYESL